LHDAKLRKKFETAGLKAASSLLSGGSFHLSGAFLFSWEGSYFTKTALLEKLYGM
jgi:hypothetical protein